MKRDRRSCDEWCINLTNFSISDAVLTDSIVDSKSRWTWKSAFIDAHLYNGIGNVRFVVNVKAARIRSIIFTCMPSRLQRNNCTGYNSPQCEARRNHIVYSERPHGILRREMDEDLSVLLETCATCNLKRTNRNTWKHERNRKYCVNYWFPDNVI